MIKKIFEYGSIVLLVVILRIFIITPVQVDGLSMYDTLYDDDVMLLNIVGYNFKQIERFDIVVIKYQNDKLIKRVIGLPGEYIEYKNNKLYVDGNLVDESYLNTETYDFNLEEYGYDKIPRDKYFVLGDNRQNSTDSRFIGFIDREDIMGEANIIIFPFKRFGKVE